MFRAAALLITIVLIGSPIGKAVCDVWCLTGGGATEHGACHGADEAGRPSVKALADACDSLLVAGPFVRERVQRPNGGVSVAAVAPAPLLFAHPMHRATPSRGVPDRPRPGTLRPLRI